MGIASTLAWLKMEQFSKRKGLFSSACKSGQIVTGTRHCDQELQHTITSPCEAMDALFGCPARSTASDLWPTDICKALADNVLQLEAGKRDMVAERNPSNEVIRLILRSSRGYASPKSGSSGRWEVIVKGQGSGHIGRRRLTCKSVLQASDALAVLDAGLMGVFDAMAKHVRTAANHANAAKVRPGRTRGRVPLRSVRKSVQKIKSDVRAVKNMFTTELRKRGDSVACVSSESESERTFGGSVSGSDEDTCDSMEFEHDVSAWLSSFNMSHHIPTFLRHGINCHNMFQLDTEVLCEMGITLIGDRLSILKELRKLRNRK